MNQKYDASITSDSPVSIHLRPFVMHGGCLLVQVSHSPDVESILAKRQSVIRNQNYCSDLVRRGRQVWELRMERTMGGKAAYRL